MKKKLNVEVKEIIKLVIVTYFTILIPSLVLFYFGLDSSFARWLIMLIVPILVGAFTAFNFLQSVKLGKQKPIDHNQSVKLLMTLYVKLSIALIVGYALYLLCEYLTLWIIIPLLDSIFTDNYQRMKIGIISTLIFDYTSVKSFVLAYFSYLISYHTIIFVEKKIKHKNAETV